MHDRKIFHQLKKHLSSKLITVITGMRRVGKTTAVRYLLDEVKHSNKVFIDLEKIEHRHIFNQPSYKEIQIELEIMGIDFDKPAVIALDEVQLVSEITSVIKYFYDHFGLKFIITGSSSFYLKDHFSESLAGRKRIFEMYPLDFREFLSFRGESAASLQKFALKPFQRGIYLKFKDHYQEYIRFGGFPEVVLSDLEEDKMAYLNDIINAYIELDIRLLSDFEAGYDLYRLIRLLAGRTGSLVEITKLSSILGINRNKIRNYLELLERTYFIISLPPFTKNVDREISLRKKTYLADTGILGQLAKVNSGQAFENTVANQLHQMGQLKYYRRKSGQEIDFILNEQKAFEVKETPTASDLATLTKRARALGLDEHALIGRYPPESGFRDFIWGGMIKEP
ncbi:MAG: ATP-binding protein [Lewinellaceae bacterium]|nr:ATP-binding protein [Lewinellaceae bacterium]